jgi:hypothetical protein
MPQILPFLPAIIGGVSSIAGGALANRSKQTSTTTPTVNQAYGPLQTQVLDMITKRLSSGPADMAGYTASGIGDINHTFDLIKGSQANDLTARGLGASPVAGAVDARTQVARGGQIARFQNTLPLLQRDLQTQDLGMAGNILNLGRGGTSTGTASSGGGAAGSFENLAAYIGYLAGKGVFGKQPGTSPLASMSTVSPFGFLQAGGTGMGGY